MQASAKIDHAFVSSGEPGKKTKQKRRLPRLTRKSMAVLAAVLVLVVAGGVYLAKKDDNKGPEGPVYTSDGVLLRQLNDGELQAETSKLIFEGKHNSARQLLEYQSGAADKESVQFLLASVYLGQGKHAEALEVYKKLETKNIGQVWRAQRGAGQEYEALNDKQNAASYYKKALESLKQTDNVPVKEDEIYFLEQDIKRVES